MKKLGKVCKTCEVSGENREEALRAYLRVYRETPHSATKVAPAMLMMGFSRLSGIPIMEGSEFEKGACIRRPGRIMRYLGRRWLKTTTGL